MAYFLPLPAVLSAVRGGPAAGRKTVTATTVLLLGTVPHETGSLGVSQREDLRIEDSHILRPNSSISSAWRHCKSAILRALPVRNRNH